MGWKSLFVIASQVIITGPSDGLFIYDSTGELIGSWVGTAGTDPLEDESVAQGLTVQNSAASNTTIINGSGIALTKLTGALAPPSISLADDTAATTNGTTIQSGGLTTPLVTAVVPGNTSGLGETWHSIPLAAGFSSVAGFYTPAYRMTIDGELELSGAVTGTIAGTTSFSTALPAAYQPASSVEAATALQGAAAGNTADQTPRVKVTTGGILQVLGIGNGAGATWNLDGLRFRLS